jgi:hypothetical protein
MLLRSFELSLFLVCCWADGLMDWMRLAAILSVMKTWNTLPLLLTYLDYFYYVFLTCES